MIFSSLLFIFCFLPLVTAVYYILKPFPIIVRNVWLLLASLFFYAWGEPKFVFVMMLFILLNYGFGYGLDVADRASVRKCLLAVAVVCNLSLLFIYKYLDFTIETINRVFPDSLTVRGMRLPIGISFFTFQSVSYVVDVYRKKSSAQKNPLNVGLYIAFFPQLIAGPIVRYESIAEQIKMRKESLDLYGEGVYRFLQGLLKKILLANVCGQLADPIFAEVANGNPLSFCMAWLGAIAYLFQIYYDFSGYSDMAIGLGKMFGFTFEENFNYPYYASSVTDLWRRWHISLGRWFRDYVYIPLGGSRGSKARTTFNLFVVWSLTGVWHGANWTYLFWGLCFFVLLTFEKVTKIPEKLEGRPVGGFFYRILTVLSFQIGMIFFRSPSLSKAFVYLRYMCKAGGNAWSEPAAVQYLHENWIYLVIAALLSVPLIPWIKTKLHLEDRTGFQVARAVTYILLFLYAMSFLVINFYNPFIYFNF